MRTILLIVLMAGASCAVGADEAHWRLMPIRSEAEHRAGMIGGEAEQHPQGIVRSLSHPDIIYLSHDVGQVWRSDDNGRTWEHTIGRGMPVTAGQSVAVDPMNPDTLLVVMDEAWNYLVKDYQGIYRSTDGGQHWQFVQFAEGKHQRFHQENLAYAPTHVNDTQAMRWYAGFPDNALYRSDDAGQTWGRLALLTDHDLLYAVAADPTNGDRVYVASSAGLFVSDDAGATIRRLGDLPEGGVGSVRIDPKQPTDIYTTVIDKGLYRSQDSGKTFKIAREFPAMFVFIHLTKRQTMYLTGTRGAGTQITHDGGATWHSPVMEPAAGIGRDEGRWKRGYDGGHTAILPDPRNTDSAVGYARATIWRTENGGRNFTDSSTMWTGFAWGWYTQSVAFDPVDPNRWAFFCFDIGMIRTNNGGDFYERGRLPLRWKPQGIIPHTGLYSGGYAPGAGSTTLLASAGLYWDSRVIRSEDDGRTWTMVVDTPGRYLYVGFHRADAQVAFAGNMRSLDGGRTFKPLPGLVEHDATIKGASLSQPDTLYAVNRGNNTILRSDDRGETWRVYVRADWRFQQMDSKPTFLVDPTDADRIYTVDRRGDLAVYDGQRWESLGVLAMAGGGEYRNFVRRVAVDPRKPEVIYAATHSAGLPFLFRSTDRGATWTDITGNHPRLGAGGLAVHPLTGDVFTGSIAGTRVLGPPYESEKAIYHRLPNDWRERAGR